MSCLFIIAEAGVNHNGSLDMALRLVAEAKKCGADCVKFQTFKAEEVAVDSAPKAAYQLETTDRGESQLDMLRKLELPSDAWPKIIEACRREGLAFLSTPYSLTDVEFLAGLGVGAFKVASGQIVEPYFLRAVARQGKPLIVSTGMATLAEADEAARVIREAHPFFSGPVGEGPLPPLSFLQCTTDYPSRLADANLSAIPTMAQALGLPVGYSDHTEGELACVMAVALGARIIEKHFTLDRSLPGPDQSSSADPQQFTRLVQALRQAMQALGSGRKEPCDRERANLPNMRRGIVATRDLFAGHRLEADDVCFKRPLRGVAAARLDLLVGRRLARDVRRDEFLDIGMFAEGAEQ